MVEIRKFDGDLQEVSDLIKASWGKEYRGKHKQPVMDYSSIDFLEWNLNRPDADPDLLIGAYSKGKLVAFVGGFPHKLRYNDKILRSASASFLTTHLQYQRQGIGRSLLREAIFKVIEKGYYDVITGLIDEDHASEKFFITLSNELNFRFLKLKRFTFLSKPLDKTKLMELADLPPLHKIGLQLFTKRAGADRGKAYGYEPAKDVKVICQMLNTSCNQTTLTVDWDEDTLAPLLRDRISNTLFVNRDGRKGLINYFTINLIGCRSTPKSHKMTMVDNVRFVNMSFYEKHRFVSVFCADQKKNGSCVITIPTSPVFDLTPFYTNTFLPNGRYHWYCAHDVNRKLGEDVQAGYLFLR
jgi:GNAT superfamily N-acetyltransferase